MMLHLLRLSVCRVFLFLRLQNVADCSLLADCLMKIYDFLRSIDSDVHHMDQSYLKKFHDVIDGCDAFRGRL